jgi:hypothetical protein
MMPAHCHAAAASSGKHLVVRSPKWNVRLGARADSSGHRHRNQLGPWAKRPAIATARSRRMIRSLVVESFTDDARLGSTV